MYRLTDEERDSIRRLHAHLSEFGITAPGGKWDSVLRRLTELPTPPANTAPVRVWCAAWPNLDDTNEAYVVGWLDKSEQCTRNDIKHDPGFDDAPGHVVLYPATIHVPISRPPQGTDLGEVVATRDEEQP